MPDPKQPHPVEGNDGAHLLLTAIEQSADTIVITDAKGCIQYVNPSFEVITGYCRDEVIGQNPRMLKSGLHDPDFYQLMWETLLQGRIWKGTIQNRRKDGSLFTEEVTISPVRDGGGTITNYVSVKRDVTLQLALEQQLRQSQKFEALGTLSSGIAHDFNNLLTAILGYTEMARSELVAESRLKNDLDNVYRAAQKARDLVTQIQAFGRKEEEKRSLLSVRAVVEQALEVVRAGLTPTVTLEAKLANVCGKALANPVQLQQVIVNLCTNALYSLRGRHGRILVEARSVQVDEAMAEAWPELHRGPYSMISVEDNGSGIRAELLPKVFEALNSLSVTDEHSGLGLTLAHGIVKGHGGVIKVYSEEGKGTRFHVYLPEVQGSEGTYDEDADLILGGKERVLIVDDDEVITKVMARQLERLGYATVRCTRPEDALLVLRRQPHIFDAVISDQTMPGITGIELAKEIHGIRKDLPVILCSGLAGSIDGQTLRESGIAAYIPKPLDTARLARELRNALNKDRQN